MSRCKWWILGLATALLSPSGTGPSLAAPPVRGGTVVIQAEAADAAGDPSLALFSDAAGKALTGKGFTIFDDPAHAAYSAEIILSRASVGTALGRDPHAASVEMAGTGVSVPLSTGNSDLVTLERTRLEIRIRRRETGQVVWDGAAVTVRGAGSGNGTDRAVASDLSAALLRGYPDQPADIVGVP